MQLSKMILTLAATGAALSLAAPAAARQGCGVGSHRGPRGHCVPNVRGQFYNGHGYWDGHRFYQHRVRWHGGWRYR